MVFCNIKVTGKTNSQNRSHNPYFNRWFSAIFELLVICITERVTILILIDGFLQFNMLVYRQRVENSHNPYFNRWFSAINYCYTHSYSVTKVTILILIDGFLQLTVALLLDLVKLSHNPYFNRWFSAIVKTTANITALIKSQSLF